MLANIAVIAKIGFKMPAMKTLDRKTSTRVNNDFLNVSDAAGLYIKVRLTPDAFRGLTQLINEIRLYFKKMTSPFGDDESRILPVTLTLEFTRKMGEFKRKFMEIREKVKSEWNQILSEQQTRLGALYDETKYPTADSLDSKIDFAWEVIPVPDWRNAKQCADHAIFKLEENIANELMEKFQEEEKEKIIMAQVSLWERLLDSIVHIKKTCLFGERIKAGFMKSLPEDVKLVPKLNIIQDPDLIRLCDDIEESLIGWELKQIQKDKELRKKIGLRAEVLEDKIRLRIQTGMYI